jgi:hypothetical protein
MNAITLATINPCADTTGKLPVRINSSSSLTISSCRNGLPDAPKKSKEKAQAVPDKPPSKTKPTATLADKKISGVQRLHAKSATIAPKKETDFELLEKVHSNASVSQSLRLTTGQRLKLEPPESPASSKAPTSKAKSSSVPDLSAGTGKAKNSKARRKERNYELSFTDLGESSTMLKSDPISDVELSDDDDLPLSVMAALASDFTAKKSSSGKKGSKTKTQPKATLKAKSGTTPTLTLKRAASTISLTSNSEDEALAPAASARTPASKKQKLGLKLKERTPDPKNDFGSPLFLRSEGDANESSWPGDSAARNTTLVDDIEELLAEESGKSSGFEASQTGANNALGSLATTQTSSAQYDLYNFYPPEQKTIKSSAPPSITSSHTLRTESLRAESPAPVPMEEEIFEEPLDDFADLEAWLQNGELVL